MMNPQQIMSDVTTELRPVALRLEPDDAVFTWENIDRIQATKLDTEELSVSIWTWATSI